MYKVFLLTGYKRSGKDSFYQSLLGLNDYDWIIFEQFDKYFNYDERSLVRLAFADALKAEVAQLYDIPIDADKDKIQYFYQDKLVSARHIYIQHGMGRRAEYQDYWVEKVYHQMTDPSKTYVLTDWRFINEYIYLHNKGCQIDTFRIYRDEVPEPDINDKSERELDHFSVDFLVSNKLENGFRER